MNVYPNSIPNFDNADNKQGSCAISRPDEYDEFQVNCGYDVAKAMLKHIMPDEVKGRDMDYASSGLLRAFN